jgi:hypothetical protein
MISAAPCSGMQGLAASASRGLASTASKLTLENVLNIFIIFTGFLFWKIAEFRMAIGRL